MSDSLMGFKRWNACLLKAEDCYFKLFILKGRITERRKEREREGDLPSAGIYTHIYT